MNSKVRRVITFSMAAAALLGATHSLSGPLSRVVSGIPSAQTVQTPASGPKTVSPGATAKVASGAIAQAMQPGIFTVARQSQNISIGNGAVIEIDGAGFGETPGHINLYRNRVVNKFGPAHFPGDAILELTTAPSNWHDGFILTELPQQIPDNMKAMATSLEAGVKEIKNMTMEIVVPSPNGDIRYLKSPITITFLSVNLGITPPQR